MHEPASREVLRPGKTIEQSWIQRPTLLDVNVETVAKHYNIARRNKLPVQDGAKIKMKSAYIVLYCVIFIVLDLFEDANNIVKRGKNHRALSLTDSCKPEFLLPIKIQWYLI